MSKILKMIWEFVSPFFADGFVSAVIIIAFLFLFCGFCVFIKEKLEQILDNRKVSEKKTPQISKPQISAQISNTNNTEIKIKEPVTILKSSLFYKSNNDKPELLALWLERCYRVANNQNLKDYKKENLEKVVFMRIFWKFLIFWIFR